MMNDPKGWDRDMERKRMSANQMRNDRQEAAPEGLGLQQYGNAIGAGRSSTPGAPGELVASLASLDETVENTVSCVYTLIGRLSPISVECDEVAKAGNSTASRVTEVGRRLANIEHRVYMMKVDVQSALARLEI